MATIRPATAADGTFLRRMLAHAANWWPGAPEESVEEIVGRPGTAHYIEGWPAPRDVGFVAETDAGEPVGATWWRFLPADDPGYGFVDEGTPEMSIGVEPAYRGHGLGTLLLGARIDEGRRHGLPALSLSVDPDNPALRLYERHGFRTAGRSGTSLTMLLRWPVITEPVT